MEASTAAAPTTTNNAGTTKVTTSGGAGGSAGTAVSEQGGTGGAGGGTVTAPSQQTPTSPALAPGDAAKAKETVQQRKAAEATAAELAPPPTKAEARTFASGFLLGELIKTVKAEFLTLAKPYTQLKQYEQETLLRRIQGRLEGAVKETIETIAADARLTFRADVDSVTFKDGVKAALKLGKSEHAHILADQAGKSVLIIVEDFARYMNPGDEAKGEPDQPSLFDKSRAAAEKVASGGEKPKPPAKKKASKAKPAASAKKAKKQ